MFCFITNLLGNSEFCFPRISMFPSTSSREILTFSGDKIYCFPRDQLLVATSQYKTGTVVGRSHLAHSVRVIHESMFYTQPVMPEAYDDINSCS